MVRSASRDRARVAGRIRVVMVPKSIDNDLRLPAPVTTLGYETARHVGVAARQEPDGGRADHRPLVPGRDHGASDRAPDPRHRQGGERDLHDHPRGVRPGAGPARRHRRHRRGLASSSAARWAAPRRGAAQRGAGRALQSGRGRGAAGRRPRRPGQHPRHRDRSRPQGDQRGDAAARAARHQGHVVDKTIGYELRCAAPLPDGGRVRARPRLRGGAPPASRAAAARWSTIQAGAPSPVPLADCLDPATGRGRQRAVDVDQRELPGRARVHGAAGEGRPRRRGHGGPARPRRRLRGRRAQAPLRGPRPPAVAAALSGGPALGHRDSFDCRRRARRSRACAASTSPRRQAASRRSRRGRGRRG